MTTKTLFSFINTKWGKIHPMGSKGNL